MNFHFRYWLLLGLAWVVIGYGRVRGPYDQPGMQRRREELMAALEAWRERRRADPNAH